MTDPLKDLHARFPFSNEEIKLFTFGDKYVGVMLQDEQIGVCATLGHPIRILPGQISLPDWKNIEHRIWYNAYLNALINNKEAYSDEGDIFELHPFHADSRTVMVGYFKPLVSKFRDQNIPLSIFDRAQKDKLLTPMSALHQELSHSEVVILTSTSLSNGTFAEIIPHIHPDCSVFMLGPSTPLHPSLLQIDGIKKLFGMVFKPGDVEVLSLIDQNFGTRTFGKRGKKVSL